MESAFVLLKVEYRQTLNLRVGAVVHASRPYRPVGFLFLESLKQVRLKLGSRSLGEDSVQSVAYRVELNLKQRVFLGSVYCSKVDEQLVLW